MDSSQEKEYRGLVRGAAAYILAEQDDPPFDAVELARHFHLDFVRVNADVQAAVQSERIRRDQAYTGKVIP